MTGTALTEEKEFRDIYGMDVVEIPTNRPVISVKTLDDAVYKTKKEKFNAVVEAVKEGSCETDSRFWLVRLPLKLPNFLARCSDREGIPHNVLNAKFHELEAEIVAQAGIRQVLLPLLPTWQAVVRISSWMMRQEKPGGLKIIGTERHESRRIDNQLRGRSGRQGDPGESRFYISLEDDLMRLFGSESLMKMFTALGVAEKASRSSIRCFPMQLRRHRRRSSSITSVSVRIFLDYDQVNNEQREIIYKERRQVLDGENMRDTDLQDDHRYCRQYSGHVFL